ncbi:MAG: hypothetical protein H8D50_05380 [Thaumarchaeota archaeon]|nr:hypothetical protein [Nitrososphaerota archaeon]
MEENQIKDIVDFINNQYDEEVPRPVKFVIRRKAKKIEKLDPNDFPESFRKCTLEELIMILKDAYSKKQLKF